MQALLESQAKFQAIVHAGKHKGRFVSFKNHSNNEIENEWREKHKFHGFDSVVQAQAWNVLWEWRRNFIRVHSTLKKTPAEAAGLERGSWSEIIKISDMNIMLILELINIRQP